MTPADKRRPQGTGSFFQRSSDGLWVGRIEAGYNATGGRRRLQVTAKTKAAAQRKLRDLQRRAASTTVRSAGGRVTVKAWSDQWLVRHEMEVRPNVYETDKGVVRKWIVPTLGHIVVTELEPMDLWRLTDTVVDAGRSTTTARNVQAVLRKMLRDARLFRGVDVPQVLFDVPLPSPAASDRDSIPGDQFARLVAAIGRRDDASRWFFAMLYGARQGETLGLTWDSVDLEGQAVVIRWQLREYPRDAKVPPRLRTRHLTGNQWLVQPKTKSGDRWLPLLPFIAASLAAWRELTPPNPYDLVWVDADGNPIRPHRDREEWYGIQREAGVAHPSGRPWYLHETRHTMVSWLLDEGTDRAVIAAIVGQSALVEGYIHINREAIRTALAPFAARFQIEG